MHNSIRSIIKNLIVIIVVALFIKHTEDVKALGSDEKLEITEEEWAQIEWECGFREATEDRDWGSDECECKADNSQDGDPKAWEVNPDQIDWEYGPLGEEDRSWEEEEVEDETMEAIHHFFERYGQPGSLEIRIQEDVAAFRAACLPLYELHAAVEQLNSLLDGGQYEEAYECFYLWARKEIAGRNYSEEEAYEEEEWEAYERSREGEPGYEAWLTSIYAGACDEWQDAEDAEESTHALDDLELMIALFIVLDDPEHDASSLLWRMMTNGSGEWAECRESVEELVIDGHPF